MELDILILKEKVLNKSLVVKHISAADQLLHLSVGDPQRAIHPP